MDANKSIVKYEEFGLERIEKLIYLNKQLSIVDKAINLVGKVNNESTDGVTSKKKSLDAIVDNSFKIDTSSAQLVTCSHCLIEINNRKLKSDCPNKIITCPEANCGQTFNRDKLKKHLEFQCEVYNHRRVLLDAKKRKKEDDLREKAAATAALAHAVTEHSLTLIESNQQQYPQKQYETKEVSSILITSKLTTCFQCNNTMKESQLTLHMNELCTHRSILCPNFSSGCEQKLVPLHKLQEHLTHECNVEKYRDMMVAKSKHRREMILCPACGEFVALLYLRKHERELCKNRKVHCRNHPLGCNVMVRLGERMLHEYVDGSKAVRSALYMTSHGAHLALKEDDISSPWTAEYWIYRPSAKESMKTHVRNILLLLPKYHASFACEVFIRNKVSSIVNELNKETLPTTSTDQSHISKQEAVLASKYLSQQRMDLVNSLTAYVSTYSDAVLSYLKAFQEIAISIETAYSAVQEVTKAVGFRDEEISNLIVSYPGSIMYVEEAGTTRLSKSSNRKIETANGEEVGSVTSKSINSRSSNRTNDKSNNNSVNNQENEIMMSTRNNEVDETLLNTEESNNADYEDITINNDTLENISMSNKIENEYFDNEMHDPSIVEDEDDVLEILVEEEEALVDNIKITLENIAAKTILNDVELDTVATYLYSGNSLSALCKASLAIEDPVLSNDVSKRESDLFFVSSSQPPSSHSEFEASSVRSSETNPKVTVAVGAVNHPLQHPVINKDKGQEYEEMLLVLESKGITAFLADVLIKPRRAIAKHTLSWSSWENVLELIKQGLKHDFDTLLIWRVEAGLLKSGNDKGSLAGTKLTTKQEKALEKKEKERRKRELKKQIKLNKTAAQETETENSATELGNCTTSNNENPITNDNKTDNNTEKVTTKKKEIKLINRTTELLKAGCSGGILAESSSCTSEYNHNKICLGLFSGLSILNTKIPGKESTAVVPYDLILHPGDMKELMKYNGSIGIVIIPTSIPISDKTSNEQDINEVREQLQERLEEEIINESSDTKIITNNKTILKIKSEAHSFDVKVPREKWIHIALVSSAIPNNRLTLYMDGLLMSHKKGCSFPLPMSCLGGSMQHFDTFEGALLDVRYWSTLRSSLDIQDNMNCLLDLEESIVPLSNSMNPNTKLKIKSSSSTKKNTTINMAYNIHAANHSGKGLIAWWTFEDGAGHNRVSDVTGHRFKTAIQQRKFISNIKQMIPDIATKHVIADKQKKHLSNNANDTAITTKNEVEGYFTNEDAVKYPVPEELLAMLPDQFLRLIPNSSLYKKKDVVDNLRDIDDSEIVAVSNEVCFIIDKYPWDSYLQAVPKWNWLDADTILDTTAHRNKANERNHNTMIKSKSNDDDINKERFLPVPSYRTKGLCPFEIRRQRLAIRGRALQNEIQCPLGCDTLIRMFEIRFHVQYQCERRMIQCRYDYCQSIFPFEDREEHEKSDCKYMYARNQILTEYELNNTTFPCSLCSEPIKQRDMKHHNDTTCSYRFVPCPQSDCEQSYSKCILSHKLKHHLLYECQSRKLKQRKLLIERARIRTNYLRPWGISIDIEPITPRLIENGDISGLIDNNNDTTIISKTLVFSDDDNDIIDKNIVAFS